MELADGSSKADQILLVILRGRVITTSFVIITTLLGVDFIDDAKIQLNIADRVWNFTDNGRGQFHFEFEPDSIVTDLHPLQHQIFPEYSTNLPKGMGIFEIFL